MDLTNLPNIGPTIADQLVSVGIETPQNLAEIGAEQAWLRIKVLIPRPVRIASTALKAPSWVYRRKNSPKNAWKSFVDFIKHINNDLTNAP